MSQIVAIDVYGYELTYAHGEYVMSSGRAATSQESTLVRISCEDGEQGWGEVCTLAGTYWPAFAGGARAAISEFAPALLGVDATNLGAVHAAMDGLLMGHAYAKSAIDIACWDLLGKKAALPVADLIGGRVQADFPLYEAVPLSSPEAMADFVARRSAAGITCFQVKVGNDPADDAERLRAVAKIAGPGTSLIADANGGWTLQQAVRAVRLIDELPIYLEQPCQRIEDCRIVRGLTSLPMVMDESVLTPRDLVAAKADVGAGSVNLKLGRLGGLSGARLMRDLAVSLGMSVSLEDAWGGDVTTAAVSHLAASTAAADMLSVSFFNDWTNEHVAGYRPRSREGRGSAPAEAGLGVEVDTDRLGEPLFSVRAAN
ncbi:mandelate racemase/muconate lactonizing enzyme family protein [Amycolatopsis sp. K13G38]|uniref:Mandelate racemase/muconate lactonizing enzyme family protein n=1 Tax=Amycolatopsis acididurans TaxID=2724524 RepID=A0ABX1JHX4_9PSEU|nr:mandelate racemase/muconate lactonizing enzyme family protein [Amycolatopsis acididurans]NKQ59402.1 mandelate racemase/muconate lactonizing enzyme family protein [Amycolatopsis acididurans]